MRRSHALWLISQGFDMCEFAERIYRPDRYRDACRDLGITFPEQDYKSEGQHASEWRIVRIRGLMGAGEPGGAGW